MARCITGSGGIGAVRFAFKPVPNAVFDSLTYRICTAKIPSGTVYGTGILTNAPALNANCRTSPRRAIASRCSDGTFVVQPFEPASIYMLTTAKAGFVRLWDSLDIGAKHTTGSASIVEAGATVKLSVDLLHMPEIGTLTTDSEMRWILRGTDGTVAAAIDYVVKGSGVVNSAFASGHAEVTATTTVAAFGVEFMISNLAFTSHASIRDNTKNVRFAVKVELVS